MNMENSSMVGVGIDPEGIDQNPPYYTMVLDTAWRQAEVDTNQWLQKWGVQRCGADSDKVKRAWSLLADTVYKNSSAQTFEHHMKYCTTTMPGGSGWDTPMYRPDWYNMSSLHQAWGLLLDSAEAAPQEGGCHLDAPIIFDIVDVGREFLSVAPCVAAYDALVSASTPAAVAAANATMSTLMDDVDALLKTSAGFLLGQWVADARQLAITSGAPDDADFLEWNARSQVTSWTPVTGDCGAAPSSLSGLWDYGNKAWSGLVSPYYKQRYEIYAEHKIAAYQYGDADVDGNEAGIPFLADGGADADRRHLRSRPVPGATAAIVKWACEFNREKWNNVSLPSTPVGDPLATARSLWQKYAPANP